MSNRNHLEISISEIIQYTGEIDIFRLDLAMYNFEGVYWTLQLIVNKWNTY